MQEMHDQLRREIAAASGSSLAKSLEAGSGSSLAERSPSGGGGGGSPAAQPEIGPKIFAGAKRNGSPGDVVDGTGG